jgi:hypothetical protein
LTAGADNDSPRRRAALGEAVSLVRRYVIQETVAPLRQLGRRLVLGLVGALLIAVGAVIALVGMLRALETETGHTFAGHWSFAPYLLTAVAAAAALVGFVTFGFRGVVKRGSTTHRRPATRRSGR